MVGIYVLAFLAGSVLVFGVNLLYADIERERKRKMLDQFEEEQRLLQRERAEIAVANRHLYELSVDAGDFASRQTLREKLGLFFEQSGVRMSPVRVGGIAPIMAVAVAGVIWLSTRNWMFAVVAGLTGGLLPILYVMSVRRRRLKRLQGQLPEAFDIISRMMKAGRTFPQALQTAAKDGSPPLSQEFGYCCDQQQLGMSPDAALRDLARRNGLLEIKIFVLAVSIHRQSGGNLSGLLENLSDIIRGRLRMQGMISSLTSEARVQIYVLTAMPVLSLILMSIFRPAYARELYDRPWLMIWMVVSILLGWLWMRRILKFSF